MIFRKKYISIILVLVLLVITGCNKETVQSSDDMITKFNSYVDKFNNMDNFQITYNFFYSYPYEQTKKIGLFQKDNNLRISAKSDNDAYMYSNFEILTSKDDIIICQKTKTVIAGSENEIRCSTLENNQKYFYEYYLDTININKKLHIINNDLDINYQGEKEIINTKCDSFKINFENVKEMTDSMPGLNISTFLNLQEMPGFYKFYMNICLNKELGTILELNVFAEKNDKKLLGYEITSFDEDVDDSVFDIPATFNIIKTGSDKEFNLIAILNMFKNYNGNVKVNFLNPDSENREIVDTVDLGTLNLKSNELKVITVPNNKKLNSIYGGEFEICFGGECISDFFSKSQDNINYNCLNMSENEINCKINTNCMFKDNFCQELDCYKLNWEECQIYNKCTYNGAKNIGYCTTSKDLEPKNTAEIFIDTNVIQSLKSNGKIYIKNLINKNLNITSIRIDELESETTKCSSKKIFTLLKNNTNEIIIENCQLELGKNYFVYFSSDAFVKREKVVAE